MVKLKLYFKGGLGFIFYSEVIMSIIILIYAIYQMIGNKILNGLLDMVFFILFVFMAVRGYKNRFKLNSQEVEVEKYEEI